MRVTDRFECFAETIRSSRDKLVSEFIDVSTAADHEFSKEIHRQRYARYIHSLGCLQYGERFLQELERIYASGVVARPTFSLDPHVAEMANSLNRKAA